MALSLTTRAEKESQKRRIEPQLVLEIAGVSTVFSAVQILRLIRIGDDGLTIGDSWRIGGYQAVEDQENLISLDSSSGVSITQQLQPDKGSVSSVSSVQVALCDDRLKVSRLISPGVVIEDILGAKATLWLGFKDTAFKEDYIPVFSGIIDDVESGAGLVKLNIAHPDQLKRQIIYAPIDVQLASTIDGITTTIPLVSTDGLPAPLNGPGGSPDPAIRFYVQLEDEIIRYTGISGNNLTGCTRAALATEAVVHDVAEGDITGKSLISLEDSVINCALKIMLSGVNGDWADDIAIERYLHPTPFTTVANSIFFKGVDLNRDYGVTEGDYITITGATNSENNCSLKVIQEMDTTEDGTWLIVSGVSFVEELVTSAKAAFRSQYDTLGYGLGMTPDQVDINEHVFWNEYQLASFNYRFVFENEINGKDFLDKEVYMPIGGYSIPRQGRASMGYHIGPVARGELKVLNAANIRNPHQIKLRRTTNKNFYNTVVFKFDKILGEDKYASGTVAYSDTSRSRIRVGAKALTVASAGLRRDQGGIAIAERASERYLARYGFAAEFFDNIQVLFRDGFAIEPGDPVMLDPEGLKITNFNDGTRNKPAKVFIVVNKKLDLKSGDISLSLVDANFDETERYGSVSPSSIVAAGSTTTEVMIQDSFGALYPGNEAKKWENYIGLPITIHSVDWAVEETVTLAGIDPNNRYKLLLDASTPLSSPPSAGYVVDIVAYPTGNDQTENALYKASHVFICKGIGIVPPSSSTTQVKVATPDIADVRIGDKVRVRNYNYTQYSDEVEIRNIEEYDALYSTITFATSLGFTPDTTASIDAIRFPDRSDFYRIF